VIVSVAALGTGTASARPADNRPAPADCAVQQDPRPAAAGIKVWPAGDSTTGMRSGDYLIVQFGIDDGDRACPRHVGSARYQQLLGVIAKSAKDRGVRPIFVTPVAAITCSGSTAVGNRGFLAETFSAGSANQVPVIDLHKLSTTPYNSLGLCPNNGDYTQGAVGVFFCNEHTHFEAAGARRIAEVVATALRTQQIGLASYLR
jgi:lysophospholipase L1-like esterase